jgi:fructuronate reductase
VVDRITPAVTAADRAAVLAATGVADRAPVVTEPFSEWVISGTFAAGRPAWDSAGAVFTDDVTPFEQRKLWLLNGAHSLLAYAGPVHGHRTVAAAIADDWCRDLVERWWDEASSHLSLAPPAVRAYRQALLERFANQRIEHLLAQIAVDGSQKLAVRIVPVLVAERAAGRLPQGAIMTLAAWFCHVNTAGDRLRDANAGAVGEAMSASPRRTALARLLELLSVGLGQDAELVQAVLARADDLERR